MSLHFVSQHMKKMTGDGSLDQDRLQKIYKAQARKAPVARIAIATPESDARLAKEYGDRGYKDAQAGKPRQVKQGGLVTHWYNVGYNRFLAQLDRNG